MVENKLDVVWSIEISSSLVNPVVKLASKEFIIYNLPDMLNLSDKLRLVRNDTGNVAVPQ